MLLHLIRKQDIDIYDIPIGKITAQYLAYVEKLRELDVNVAAEFIYMAAVLIHIKSKMLLPRDPAAASEAQDDPRAELVNRLIEHEKFKSAAQMLMQKQQIEDAVWSNPAMKEFRDAEGTEPEMAADVIDLVKTFQQIIDRCPQPAHDSSGRGNRHRRADDRLFATALVAGRPAHPAETDVAQRRVKASTGLHVSSSAGNGSTASHPVAARPLVRRNPAAQACGIRSGHGGTGRGTRRLAVTAAPGSQELMSLKAKLEAIIYAAEIAGHAGSTNRIGQGVSDQRRRRRRHRSQVARASRAWSN